MSTEIIPTNDRRAFLQQCAAILSGVAFVGAAAPLLQGCATTKSAATTSENGAVSVDVTSLDTDGKYLVTDIIHSISSPLLIVRQSEGKFEALSMRCTHKGCMVNPPSGGFMQCPCHGAQFDLTGAVVRGPARDPLASFTTTYDASAKKVLVTMNSELAPAGH